MRRVIEQRLTPQYVSVHATDLAVRAYLLGVDEKRADISDKMQQLIDAGAKPLLEMQQRAANLGCFG